MKRVLHIMHSLERSGMEMMLLNSSEEWSHHGYKCDVLATAEAEGPIAPQMREAGYGVYHIPFRKKGDFWPRVAFVQEFYQRCKSGYDVVHIHTEAAPPIYAILAKLAGVRRIAVTPHGIFNFKGVLRVRKRFERQLVHVLGGRYGIISENIRKCEWERFRSKGVRIWNWMDTSHFQPPTTDQRASVRDSLGIREGQFVITSVGNCSSVKNHNAIFHALPLLPKTIQPLYLHVGREMPGFPERKLVAELKIENSVRFLESQADTLPFLWAADVFVMPSLNEGLGMAALEAVAAGTPLVCSKVEGLSEVATETRWAVLTSTTAESVAEGLAKVAATEPSIRRQRALSDSQPVRDKFSVQRGVQSIVDGLYA